MKWTIWAILLVSQNFSFTLVSRSRNSGSLPYHAACSALSNLIFFVSSIIMVDNIVTMIRNSDWWMGFFLATFYTVFTVSGSIAGHYVSMRWLEKGSRRVGSA